MNFICQDDEFFFFCYLTEFLYNFKKREGERVLIKNMILFSSMTQMNNYVCVKQTHTARLP